MSTPDDGQTAQLAVPVAKMSDECESSHTCNYNCAREHVMAQVLGIDLLISSICLTADSRR